MDKPDPNAAVDAEWWRGAVIYQIYPRSFADTDGDGVGDLRGVRAHLDHVAGLGVDAIWLCPFFRSPQRDFGYDVSDHLAVDPLFGTLADFDDVVAHAHALGVKVLIDQVWSHTSDAHAWFHASRTDRGGPHGDFYVWADPRPDGTAPTNWLSVFGGPAWRWEARRRQYYLHHFLCDQPALNLHNPLVVDALLDGARFWLDRGVDGFRVDAVDFLVHDRELRDNPPSGQPPGTKIFGMQRHLHDMLQPEGLDIMGRLRGLLDTYPGAVGLGEVSSQAGAFDRVRAATSGHHLHMAYTLAPLRGGFDHATVRALIAEAADGHGWPCWSFSNHDVERAAGRWHPRGRAAGHDPRFVRLLMTLLLTLRGSVSLYQGEELGLLDAELALADLRDPFGIAHWPEFAGRDGSRTPMPWQADAPNGGFTSGTPWLPLPAEHLRLAADRQQGGLLAEWTRLLAFRRATPALRRGKLTPVSLAPPLVGFIREEDGQRVVVVLNLSESSADLPALEPAPIIEGLSTVVGGVFPAFGVMVCRHGPIAPE